MKELKVKVWNYKNVVLFEVLEQDESLRGIREIYTASNGIQIVSTFEPGIVSDEIYILGDDISSDNLVDEYNCRSTKDARQLVKDIKQAVAEYNESIKEILTDKEKEYLNKVIEPFKNKIKFICLLKDSKEEYNYLKIAYVDVDNYCIDLDFPFFKEGKYYKNMEINREYTLKELGLEE